MKGFEASLEIGEEELCISSVAKSEVIEWKSICEIKHYKNFWILVLSPNLYDYVILPANELSKGIKDNIESRIHSVLYTSGQGWKIRAQLACGNLSIIFLLVPFVIDSFPSQWVVSSYLIGGLFAIVSIYYLFNIRCPKCRANWRSQVTETKTGSRWPFSLRSLRKCPKCGASCNEFQQGELNQPAL
jgi:predicted nucleic-acid-binding Zn-ribbon protein